MSGPGQYLPDVTEGITRPEDLPTAKIIQINVEVSPACDDALVGRVPAVQFPEMATVESENGTTIDRRIGQDLVIRTATATRFLHREHIVTQ